MSEFQISWAKLTAEGKSDRNLSQYHEEYPRLIIIYQYIFGFFSDAFFLK